MKTRPSYSLYAACLIVLGCSAPVPGAAGDYDEPREWATIQLDKPLESSGLAVSTFGDQPLLWTNVDGPSGRFFLIDEQGEIRATCDLKNVAPTDCEDLAGYRIGERRYLMFADTGDNKSLRSSYALHIIAEPDPARLAAERDAKSAKKKKHDRHEIERLAEIPFYYPDGPHNCEAIGVDVENRTILLVTKEQARGCAVYSLPLPIPSDEHGAIATPSKPLQAVFVARLDVPTITGGAVSPDGERFVLIGRASLFEFVRRKQADGVWENWKSVIERGPTVLSKPKQEQGEAVCFDRDGKSLFISSEGKRQPIWSLPRKAIAPSK